MRYCRGPAACGCPPYAGNITAMQIRTMIFAGLCFTALAVNVSGCASLHHWPPGLTSADRQELKAMPAISTAWPGGPADGRIIRTAHYRIYTTIDNPLQQRLIARVLEADYTRFIRLVPGAVPALPMTGYVFRNRSQWARYTRQTTGAQASIYLRIEAGGYERNGVFAAYRSNIAEILSVVAHEAWHQFSFLSLQDHLPAWLDEGLATQCEAMQWHDGYPVFTPWLNATRWEMLRQAVEHRQLMPLGVLAGTQAGSVVMHHIDYVDAYYAEVWSLMLFLEHSRYRPDLLTLLRMARKGQLNNLLSGTTLTASDKQHLTLRWNRVAGEIYLRHFFSSHRGMQSRYVAFIDRLVQSWPPPKPAVGPGLATLPVHRAGNRSLQGTKP